MIIPGVLRRKFRAIEPLVAEASSRAEQTLKLHCEENQFPFVSRYKTEHSLVEKIETGRFKRWSEIDDLYACTVIVPTYAEEKAVVEFCRSVFDCKVIDRTTFKKDPRVFRFDSIRINANLRQPPGLPRSRELTIYDVPFEIQVRTAFEHAWSVTTHSLVYKSSQVDWRRVRLAAEIKANVEQLDTLIRGFNELSKRVPLSDWPELREKKMIAGHAERWFKNGLVPEEFCPKDISRFADNFWVLIRFYNRRRSEEKRLKIEKALAHLNSVFGGLEGSQFPRSVSFFQFCLGTLKNDGLVDDFRQGYAAHVTPELLEVFPKTAAIEETFDYEL